MTYALSLMLWMATAQTVGQPDAVPAVGRVAAPAAAPTTTPAAEPPAAPATTSAAVVVQCPPTDAERALQDQLDEARGQLDEALRDAAEAKEQVAKLKEESSMPDHAIAALLVSDHPGLAPLKRIGVRMASGAARWRIRGAVAEVYMSPRRDETMTAVILTLRNPREAPTWEPKEAFIRLSVWRQDVPLPVALRSSPERIRPGETARIVLVFDRSDLRFDEPYTTLALLRDGEFEMEIVLPTSDFLVASGKSGGNR